jgi:hypothetical protein
VRGRAIEDAVVHVEMALGGVDVVVPQQADDSRPVPNALEVGGRPTHLARDLGNLIDLALSSGFRFGRFGVGILVLSKRRDW